VHGVIEEFFKFNAKFRFVAPLLMDGLHY